MTLHNTLKELLHYCIFLKKQRDFGRIISVRNISYEHNSIDRGNRWCLMLHTLCNMNEYTRHV